MILCLAERGADISKTVAVGHQLVYPLSIASKLGQWHAAALLIRLGAAKRWTHREVGRRVLHRSNLTAALFPTIGRQSILPEDRQARRRVILDLLSSGKDPNEVHHFESGPTSKSSPLLFILVSRERHWEAEVLLRNSNVDVDRPTSDGITALEWTLSPRHGVPELAVLLLRCGAKVSQFAA